MKAQWDRIEQWLSTKGCLEQMRLRAGASTSGIEGLEAHLGVRLSESLKAFLSVHDGQDETVGLVGGELLLSIEGIRQEWDLWRSLDEEAMNADSADFMASHPEGFIKPMYTNRLWIPLTKDWGGNHIGLDYDPDEKGSSGQVIRFGRDEETKRLIADSFEDFVGKLVLAVGASEWNGEYLAMTI
ncbi:KNR4-like cell wall assembly/cell proliferation coordinating protein [Trinickia terrae]|uniref:KNR4-like cell wall assembly/cell proliferation coordinating protein n=1 Tax=Trinickia terrae TaxID=2571161 RepID=A0A4U1HGK9_9BURK|nr:SMI1/KNR4 family protein [Trinickia terrae]TKC80195.1 KNR4-like cell wall assembly/cell proliferation coordinating protein [Trinickia terrae]